MGKRIFFGNSHYRRTVINPAHQSFYRAINQNDSCAGTCYCKIPKIIIYFSKTLFEGLIFGGAFIRRGLCMEGNLHLKIDWVSLILGRKFTVFLCLLYI